MSHIHAFVPDDLQNQLDLLRSLISSSALPKREKGVSMLNRTDDALSKCIEAIQERRDGRIPEIDRISLRNEILGLARVVEEELGNSLESQVEMKNIVAGLRLASQKMGTVDGGGMQWTPNVAE